MGGLSIFWDLVQFLSWETWSSCIQIYFLLRQSHTKEFSIISGYCEGCYFPNIFSSRFMLSKGKWLICFSLFFLQTNPIVFHISVKGKREVQELDHTWTTVLFSLSQWIVQENVLLEDCEKTLVREVIHQILSIYIVLYLIQCVVCSENATSCSQWM